MASGCQFVWFVREEIRRLGEFSPLPELCTAVPLGLAKQFAM